jgi:hypothetical protein
MFASFADTLDKRIENVIEKQMAKAEKTEKKEEEKGDENKDETEVLIDDEVQFFLSSFVAKKVHY